MKKYTVLSAVALTCFTLMGAEMSGTRFAGYTTNVLVGTNFSIVAVPFSGFDTNAFAVASLSLDKLICTNGIPLGSRLIAFDEANKDYHYYSLEAAGWNPLTVNQVSPDSTNLVVNAPPLSTILRAQGYAFWLKTTNGVATAILQGVVNTNDTSVAIAADAFTLIGNALPTELLLNDSSFTNANPWFTAGPPGFGDEIHAVNGRTYLKNVFFGGRWKLVEQTPSNTVFTADSANIPAGSGVWYKRIGGSATFILK